MLPTRTRHAAAIGVTLAQRRATPSATEGLNNVHAPHPDLDEPLMAQQSESEGDEERQRLADRVLGRLEDAVYWGIALVLIIGSGALLISQFHSLLTLRSSPAKIVMLEVLDGLLLIFIFVELLYAVRACLRSHEIVDRAVSDCRHPGGHQGDRRVVRRGDDPP